MPRAKKRCAQIDCRQYAPCPDHSWRRSAGYRPLPSNWNSLRKKARNFDTKKCYACGRTDPNGQVDHIINRAEGGTDHPSNLAWICKSLRDNCHDKKTQAETQRGKDRRWK